MSKEKKLKAEIVFESDETRVLRNKIRHQEEQEELDEKKKLEREQERRRRRISNQKKFKKYQSMIKRIAFSNETADRLHTLKKNLKKQTQTFLTFFLTTSNKMKRKEKEKKKKLIKENLLKSMKKQNFIYFHWIL
ncbi:hypothetical protein M0813_14304 [Anaeramoeba flamelloides]|uniref:Uncharacterized protein n=1 Tax=Anaeramoeba flamelloides TaxID=1746091 RepID=A0ABQ8Z5J1_9EUKA|nr:hypothetical protein M0813_14304 [Anaeramoeba flamelloides]